MTSPDIENHFPRNSSSQDSSNKKNSTSNVTQVFGTFRIVDSTSSPRSRIYPNAPLTRENWWAAQNINNNLHHRNAINQHPSINASAYTHAYQRSFMDDQQNDSAHRRLYHTSDGIGNNDQHRYKESAQADSQMHITNHTPKERTHSSDMPHSSPFKGTRSNNYVTPPRYRPGFTNRPVAHGTNSNGSRGHPSSISYSMNRSELIHKDSLRRNNKMQNNNHHKQRNQSNRYYAYNTHAPRKNASASNSRWTSNRISDDVLSSLTTPELIISTMGPVPDELPLSLAIMVGEDPAVDMSSWKSNTKHITGKSMQNMPTMK